jgi:hypothetical protein
MTTNDDFDDELDETEDEMPRRRAGLRPDERDPDEPAESGDIGGVHAVGTPGGGLASGGLAGTNSGDGAPQNADLDEAMGSGIFDNSGDRVEDDEPQSGRAGGAVGGTPAGKRSSPRDS